MMKAEETTVRRCQIHPKAKVCTEIGCSVVCLDCRNDACEGYHRVSSGERAVSNQVRLRRDKYHANQRKESVTLEPRKATLDIGSLCEDTLAKSVTDCIVEEETKHRTSQLNPWLQVASVLNITDKVSQRTLSRANCFTLEQVKDSRITGDIRSFLEAVIRQILETGTSSLDAARAIEASFFQHYTSLRDSTSSRTLDELCDRFMRTQDDIKEREYFAILFRVASSSKELKTLLEAARTRALNDDGLKSITKSRFYSRRSTVASEQNSNDSEIVVNGGGNGKKKLKKLKSL
jgi:hypothetical protein